jgi:pimeloyl-[acyl-carrier protein] synthase
MTNNESLYDPQRPDFLDNPYPAYQRLLQEAPLYRLPKGVLHLQVPVSGEWLLSSHEYVSFALKDPRFIREALKLYPPKEGAAPPPEFMRKLSTGLNSMMLFRDPPNHTRLRGLVNKAFMPVQVESLRPRILDIARHLLSLAEGLKEFDLLREYALPLPVIVIGEMLGVPVEDRDLFKKWSISIALTLDATQSNPAVFAEAAKSVEELSAYLRDIIRERQANPQNDILTSLIRAEEEGERLNEQELISTCMLLLIAGHETTTNLIGNGYWTLHRHPEAKAQLKETPELMESAVEELLRFESPVQRTIRFIEQPVRIGDQELQSGDAVSILIGAANRDSNVFRNPDTFDIARQPNRHLAFGSGIHFCLGAPLARMEGQIALGQLISAQRKLTVATERPEWRVLSSFRGLERLPVRWES